MKENRERKGYAAALQRKQQVAASHDSDTHLPRVAALSARPLSRLSPLRGSVSDRPLSSLKNVGAARLPSASAHRVGCRPATHSTSLVPLADATARGRGVRATSAASRAPGPAAVQVPSVPAISASTTIGDPGLDSEEAALQAELAAVEQRLENLHLQQAQRRSATPEPEPRPPSSAAAPLGVVPAPAAALTPATVVQTSWATAPAASQPQPSPQPEPQLAALPEPHPQEPVVPPQDQSIVRSVVTATGTGCRDIIAAHVATALPHSACWTTRGHRVLYLESSCILQLWGRRVSDVTLRITFADAASVPRLVRLEHAPTPTAAFERLGDIKLQPKSLQQLKHLFRLGKGLEVQRCLRITLVGHMAEQDSGTHRVTHMLLTSGQGPQRTQSALSNLTGADPLSARSAQASVNGSAPSSRAPEPRATADSAASGVPSSSAFSAAAAPAAAVQEQRQSLTVPSELLVPRLDLSITNLSASADAAELPAQPALLVAAASPAAEQTQSTPPLEPAKVEGTAWGRLEEGPAEMDFRASLMEEFAPQADSPATTSATASAPAKTSCKSVLPPERCSAVGAMLARLGLAPVAGREALLQLLEPERSCAAAPLSEEQAAELLACLPSAEERQALAAHAGPASELSAAEQFMLEVAAVPALELRLQAWRFRAQFTGRARAAEEAAALLGTACEEAQRSEVLRTVLKVTLLAANFLNAGNEGGVASGFQIDALLKLKDVRSSRKRSRTLLHFIAREVARQLPTGASLAADLPSAGAAARLDRAAVAEELRELAAEARVVESMLMGSSRFRALQAFRAEVLERLAGLQAQADEADASFKRLGGVINARRSTLASPAAFFSVLHTFAAELDAAHEENAAADADADNKESSGRKPQRGRSQSGSPATSAASGASRRQRSTAQESLRGSLSMAAASAEHRLAAASAAGSGPERRQHSPSPCMSKAALTGLCGSQRGEGTGSPPAASAVDVASLLRASADSQGAEPGEQQQQEQGSRLSSPVANLLRESARLISSVDLGPGGGGGGGFGSAIIPAAAASSGSHASSARNTAATPDGAVQSAETEADDACSTPRSGAVSQRPQSPAGQAAGAAASQAWQQRYMAATTFEEMVAAVSLAAPAAEQPEASGAVAGRSLSQLRQRSLQQLSPTSTPLSSLGRQSSRSSQYSSDAGGSTPGSSLRFRVSLLRRSSSPLGPVAPAGLGAAVVEAEAAAFRGRAAAAAMAAAGHGGAAMAESGQAAYSHHRPDAMHGGEAEGHSPACAHCVASQQQQQQLAVAVQHLAQQAAAAAAAMYASTSDEEELDALPTAAEEATLAAEVLAQARPPRGFGALHSRASSVDLAFFAPFTCDQLGEGALLGEEAQEQGMRASFMLSQGSGSAWGPLAAQQERLHASTGLGGPLRHASVDDLALPRASSVAGSKRVAFSLPASPRHSTGSRPLPLNLQGLTGRLQAHQSADAARHQQLSPVLEALLSSVPTPAPPTGASADLAADDLADMADCSSDHEAEWQALERIQAQDEQWRRQQAAEQEARELALLQQQQQREREPTPEWTSRDQLEGWLAAAAAVGQPAGASHRQHTPVQLGQARGEEEAELDAEQAALAMLPSPITSATSNLDAAVCRLLASAGNTPTGPLGHHQRTASLGIAAGQQHQVVLLEPVMPAPLGEGVRASQRMAEGVPAAALRQSVEGPRAMLRPASTGQLASAQSAPTAALSMEAAAWAAAQPQAAAPLGGSGAPFGEQWAAAGGGSARGAAAEWEAGPGPSRRRGLRGLRKLLSKQH